MQSCVIYKFCCASNVGSTKHCLKIRVDEHSGVSSRTSRPLARPSQSAIRDHTLQCTDNIPNINSFNILCSASSINDLRILESIYIHKLKPNLNEMLSALPLLVTSG